MPSPISIMSPGLASISSFCRSAFAVALGASATGFGGSVGPQADGKRQDRNCCEDAAHPALPVIVALAGLSGWTGQCQVAGSSLTASLPKRKRPPLGEGAAASDRRERETPVAGGWSAVTGSAPTAPGRLRQRSAGSRQCCCRGSSAGRNAEAAGDSGCSRSRRRSWLCVAAVPEVIATTPVVVVAAGVVPATTDVRRSSAAVVAAVVTIAVTIVAIVQSRSWPRPRSLSHRDHVAAATLVGEGRRH